MTGGNGLVGRHLIPMLLSSGYRVRSLVRKPPATPLSGVEYFSGDITDAGSLPPFLESASLVFHCAAELNDETLMWAVNVKGAQNLALASKAAGVDYFCLFSSAGVVGLSATTCISEGVDCSPRNTYERTKLAAEKAVLAAFPSKRLVILRPTNVVDDIRSDVLQQAYRGGVSARLKFFFKGGECAHLVHSHDVAAAAIHLIGTGDISYGECFFVSCDQDENNYFSCLWSMVKSRGANSEGAGLVYLPIAIPYLIRAGFGRRANKGNVKYSSEKLFSTGFTYTYTVEKMVLAFCERAEH